MSDDRKETEYSLLMAVTILSTVAAILTLLPSRGVSKRSVMGYKAWCPWSPMSTALLLGAAGLSCVARGEWLDGKSASGASSTEQPAEASEGTTA